VDWRGMYNGLRDAAICRPGAGYIIHESARWSDVHGQWLFLPRKSSRQPYDEVKDAHKCVNLMMCAPEGLGEAQGDKVALKDYLTKSDLRGCSDFLFVPGTNDCHLFVVRTEETLEGAITTYCSVIDLAANVLMGEMTLAADRKFEGAAWVGGFGPFPPNGPTEEVVLPPTAETAADAKADEPAAEAAADTSAEVADIDLNDPEVQASATKIQASFRGHQARKEVAAMKATGEPATEPAAEATADEPAAEATADTKADEPATEPAAEATAAAP